MTFAGLVVSLRVPRVAVLIPTRGWELHARRGLEFFTRTWGGESGVLIPTSGGSSAIHPAVRRLLHRYDPDYITTLGVTLRDIETLQPGLVELRDHRKRRVLSPARRDRYITNVESMNSNVLDAAVSSEILDAVTEIFSTFHEHEFRSRRINRVHPFEEPSRLLSRITLAPDHQVSVATEDPIIDLAFGLQRGIPDAPTSTLSIADQSLSMFEASRILTKGANSTTPRPFQSGTTGLTRINHGLVRDGGPVVVLGRTANDFALAMAWDRLVGTGIWLPLTGRHTRWHPYVGVDLDLAAVQGHEKFRVTSTSLNADECSKLMSRIWAARWMRDSSGVAPDPWVYVPPDRLETTGRVDLRIVDRWDVRHTVPTEAHSDGSAEMAATLPLTVPEGLPDSLRGWVVDVEWPGHPIQQHCGIKHRDLIARDQNEYETFVRPSAVGISFESGRWDMVWAGSSQYGALAQPKLRWPGMMNSLSAASATHGHAVQPSHAGKVARIAGELWGGRIALTDDLIGHNRELLLAFTSSKTKNGPADAGAHITDDDRRIILSGNCLVPFDALTRMLKPDLDPQYIRSWLDAKVETGAVRMGLALECGVCPWPDFYRTDELGTHFECKRCGSRNALVHQRWRKPASAPRWYYTLHPTVVQFLNDNGDVPLLAVRAYNQTLRTWQPEFEVELIRAGETRPSMEIDFAFSVREGLVVGEAKSVGRLDGSTDKERTRDARKLIEAAEILGAVEACFASTKEWAPTAIDAIAAAVVETRTLVRISAIEGVASGKAAVRQILHNPGGP